MVGVTYLNCDQWSLRAKAAKFDKRVRELIDDLHIQRRHQLRGCRAGRLARRDAKPRIRQLGIPRCDSGDKLTSRHVFVRPVGNGAYVISGNRHPPHRRSARDRTLINVPIVRQLHAKPVGCVLSFGSMNIRSLSPSKLNSLLLELNDHPIEVMLLRETWHHADSVAIRRLRAEGYSVVERARPRTRRADEKHRCQPRRRCHHRSRWRTSVTSQHRATTDDLRVRGRPCTVWLVIMRRYRRIPPGLGTYHCRVLRRVSRHPRQPGDVRRSHCPRR